VIQDPDLIGRAQRFAAAAFAFYEKHPFSSTGGHAAKRFYRASSSAAMNYCAAKRGRSTAEFISKLATVVEEIDEAVRWLEHMRDIRPLSIPICFRKQSSCGGSGVRLSARLAAMIRPGNSD